MLFKKQAHGKTLYASKSLLVPPQQAYIRPPDSGNDWFQTSCSIWRVDELIRRRVRDWKRLLGEDGHTGTRSETMRADHDSAYTATHSVFPAPLVEWILLRYGGPVGGAVLDAFSGGPVRAVVSTIMNFNYLGFEIRKEQINENETRLKQLNLTGAKFILGDGRFMEEAEGQFDIGFTCPPYSNLEVYSDLPNDLSNMKTYDEFIAGISFCADAYFRLLKPKAFVCFVVGPFRDKSGELVDFPAHAVDCFREVGFVYHQQIILSKNFGSAAKRSGNAWKNSKLVPIHEFLLVFRKPES